MTLTELEDALKEACLGSYKCGCYDIDNLPKLFWDKLEVVEDGGWTQDYKYQHQDTVVKDDEGNHFMLSNTRSGSPFSDWDYGEPNICQVEPKVETITRVVWKTV